MPIYMFDIGNSNDGPLGAVIRVHGTSKQDALDNLRLEVSKSDALVDGSNENADEGSIDTIVVFCEPRYVTVANIIDDETEGCIRYECDSCGKYSLLGSDEETE